MYSGRTYNRMKNTKVFYCTKTIKGKCDFTDSSNPLIQVKSGTYLIQDPYTECLFTLKILVLQLTCTSPPLPKSHAIKII